MQLRVLEHVKAVGSPSHLVQGKFWAVLVAVAVFGSIAAILRSRGLRVSCLACLYVGSLVAIALSMRELTGPWLHYTFPACATTLHYIATWVFCILYLAARGEGNLCLPASLGPPKVYIVRVLPIALALPISIVLNNKALVYIGAGLAAIVGTLSPVCTAVLSRFFGRRLTLTSWLGVFIAFVGAFWAGGTELRLILLRESHADAQSKTGGLLFALGAVVMRSIRVVLQDTLLSPSAYTENSGRPAEEIRTKEELKMGQQPTATAPISGMHLLAVQSPAVVAVSVLFTLATEHVGRAWHSLTAPVVLLLALTAVLATMVNVFGACVLKELGSTSMQIIGKLNTIITTAVSMSFFRESLPVAVLCGSAVLLVGVAFFEIGELRAKH